MGGKSIIKSILWFIISILLSVVISMAGVLIKFKFDSAWNTDIDLAYVTFFCTVTSLSIFWVLYIGDFIFKWRG